MIRSKPFHFRLFRFVFIANWLAVVQLFLALAAPSEYQWITIVPAAIGFLFAILSVYTSIFGIIYLASRLKELTRSEKGIFIYLIVIYVVPLVVFISRDINSLPSSLLTILVPLQNGFTYLFMIVYWGLLATLGWGILILHRSTTVVKFVIALMLFILLLTFGAWAFRSSYLETKYGDESTSTLTDYIQLRPAIFESF